MEFCLWIVIGILICVIAGMLYRQFLIRKVIREIREEFTRRLETDTNGLICLSYQDPALAQLASDMNDQLRKLRKQRLRFLQGDMELKNAIANISHDLRTPLTAISGYLELLKDTEKSEDAERYLSQITGRVEVMKQLSEELFRYSVAASVQELAAETVDLRKILEESLLSFYGTMEQKGIVPEIHICESAVNRTMDRSAVSRVFGNIISNAMKYSDGDFKVTMSAKGNIVFANTTRGLTSLDAERLFDRFYTVETGRNSSGLGLSIAKLLTEKMGGTIEAEYEGEKLFIILKFPCMDDNSRL